MKSQLGIILKLLYDPDELVDVLQISSEEILDRFEDKLTQEMFEEYCGMEVDEDDTINQ